MSGNGRTDASLRARACERELDLRNTETTYVIFLSSLAGYTVYDKKKVKKLEKIEFYII